MFQLMKTGMEYGLIGISAAVTFAVIGLALFLLVTAIAGLISGHGTIEKDSKKEE